MQLFQSLGKILIIFGIFLVVLGLFFLFAGKIPPMGRVFDWIGKLPGDIVIKRKNFSLYIPITTSIILSILLTLVFWLLSKR